MIPGFSLRSNPRLANLNFVINPERVCWLANPFRVRTPVDVMIPGFSLRSNPRLKLANAFGVDEQRRGMFCLVLYFRNSSI